MIALQKLLTMSAVTPQAKTAFQPKTVLETILEWSSDRPGWQRDALRRIVQKGHLDDNDIAELVALCKEGRTAGAGTSGKVQPLKKSHLPANPGAGASVSLIAIKDTSGVNSLASSQTLPFAPTGITAIYGDNGTGKSGYARILKRACRARHSDQIIPNIYVQPTTTLPSATIIYGVGGKEQPPEIWKDTGRPVPQPHPRLSAISVFDGDCASVHIREKNEVAFRPFGLDVPDELAGACKRVKIGLEIEKRQFEAARNPLFQNPTWNANTGVGKALASLGAVTDFNKLSALATLSDDELARLNRLNEDLSKNPATAAAEQKLKADRIKSLINALAAIESTTRDNSLYHVFSLHRDAKSKRGAATSAAQGVFGSDSLPGVAGDVWRVLWDAARRYSTEVAYPAGPFPPTQPDTLCVLCQQPLKSDAVERMGRFEKFVKEDTERQAQEAERLATSASRALADQPMTLRPLRDNLKEVELQDATLVRSIRRGVASARLRRFVAIKATNEPEIALPKCEPFPVEALAKTENEIRAYSAELQKAAAVEERKRLQTERLELSDRATLHALLGIVGDEIARLGAIRFIDDCLVDTTTNAITTLGNRIADNVITPQLRDRFSKEIINLVGDKVRVEIVRAGGQYGSPQYQIRLLARPDAKVALILSEGEQTCVGIAAFLAEVATAPHASALVFDDPVSSLDHKWRHKVAERLVEESAVRQVIVFTHDLIFLNDIDEAAREKNLPCQMRHIRRFPDAVGIVNDNLPWDGMRIAARIDALEKSARTLRDVRKSQDEETYKRAARYFYDDLRAAWERALEEVAFAHVIMRHRDYIRDKELMRVSVLTEEDCKIWYDNFGKCCGHIAGHDASRGRNRAVPEPDETIADVQALDAWVKSLRERQNKLEKTRASAAH